MPSKIVIMIFTAALGLVVIACSSSASNVASTKSSEGAAEITASGGSSTTRQSPALATTSDGAMRFAIVAEASEARYRAREQLAERTLPSEAVGVTRGVSGTLVLRPDGTFVAEQSKVTVDLVSLKSDEDRRDNFLRRSTLQTSRFPTAEFVPKEVKGLPSPLPTSGEASFHLLGDLTVRGVTRPVTWQVNARFSEGAVTGQASTSITFQEFELSKPRVFLVLSIEDTLRSSVRELPRW